MSIEAGFRPSRVARAAASAPELPSASDLDETTQRRMFAALASLLLILLAVYAIVFRVRGQHAESVEALIALVGAALTFGLGLRSRSPAWALRVLAVGVFGWLAWTTLKQGEGLPAAVWWLSVIPFILAGAGMHYLAMASVFAFVATVSVLYFEPGWVSRHVGHLAVESWRRYAAIVGSEMLALWLIILALRGRARVARALELARCAANDAAELKSRFLANMSHEIRTPLTGIIGAAEVLNSRDLSEAQRQQLLGLQSRSAQTLLALVNDVLDYAKLESGQLRLEHQPVFLRGIVFESNELYSMQAFAKGVEISSSCNPDVPNSFLGDPLRLRQVVNNLVSNAVKFTERGGVHIHLSMDPRDAQDAATTSRRRRVRIEVVDSGPGLAPGQLQHLFKAFVQADAGVTRRFGGSGLGLSIAQELARLMGGRIEVHSVVGEGSRFSLVVPLTQESGEVAPSVPARRDDVLLATANPGLERHLKTLLNELEVDPLTLRHLPADAELSRCSLLLVDAPLLQALDLRAWLARHAGSGRRIAILTPLGGAAAAGLPGDVRLLYKPVRRQLLEAIVGWSDAAEGNADAALPPVPRPLAGLHVLVADDNPVNQVIVQAMLAELGAGAAVANDGREALTRVASEPFDLVLMDMHMPGMDGLAATRALRTIEASTGARRLGIVATTASLEGADRCACIAAGMDGFLTKPFGMAELRRAVEAVVVPRLRTARAKQREPEL